MKRLLLFIAALGLTGLGMINAQEATTVSFSEALTIGQALGKNVTTSTTYRTTGVVSQVKSTTANVTQYHNCDFLIVDPTGAATTSITCYRTKWLGNTNMAAADMPNEGDTVTVVGPIQNYNSNTVEFYLGYIESISRYAVPVVRDTIDVDVCGAMAAAASLTSGQYSFDYYRVTGVVDTITFSKASAMQQTFRMNCPTTAFFTAYNAFIQGDELAQAGDTVVVFGRLQNYNGTIEISGAEVTIIGPYVEPVIVPEPDPIILGFQAPEEWENVFIYSWNTQTSTGNWPGTQLTKDSLGWVYFPFVGDEEVNYIWNNGNGGAGNQTVDLTANSSKCERVGGTDVSGKYVISFAECGSILPQPIDTTTQDTTPVITIHDVTVAEALTVGALLGYSETTTDLYRVYGVVSNVATWKDKIVTYGNCNLYIQTPGDSAELYCYKTNWLGNAAFTNADDIPVVGDTVTVIGSIQNYKGNTIELMQGYIESIARYVEPQPIDTTEITPITLGFQPTTWDEVYLHYWNTNEEIGSTTWPGIQLYPDSNGWYYYTFNNDTVVNYVWNNGAGYQTHDFQSRSSLCLREDRQEDNIFFDVIGVECGAVFVPDTTTKLTVAEAVILEDGAIVNLNELKVTFVKITSEYTYYYAKDTTGYIHIRVQGAIYDGPTAGDYVRGVKGMLFANSGTPFIVPMVGLEDLIVTKGMAEELPLLTSVPTASDVNRVFRIENADMGEYVYTFTETPSTFGFDLGNGEVVDIRNAWRDTITFHPGYTYDMIGCVSVYSEGVRLNVTNFVINSRPDTVPPAEPIVMRLSKTSADAAGWENVYAYVWDNDYVNYFGTWPGTYVQLDSTGNWYEVEVASSFAPFNLIWNNGVGGGMTQTIDLMDITTSQCHGLRHGEYLTNYAVTLLDCDAIDTLPSPDSTFYTVYFTMPWAMGATLIDSVIVAAGQSAIAPAAPVVDGYEFMSWNASLSEIWYDQTISASYKLSYPDSVEARTPITVRIQASSVPETWENLYLFSWTVPYGSEANTGQGVLLTADSTGWYTYTFDRAVTSVDFLLNNGDWGFGNQTVDVNDLTASYCIQMGAPLADTLAYHMIYLTDCGFDPYIPAETLPEDEQLTVRLIKPAYGWQHVYLFQWDDNGALLGEWPGIELTPDSLGWCSYTFPYDTVVNIIWNSGVSNGNLINQTQDITGLNHSADFRLNGNFYDENREAFLTLADELPAGANPADYHTVAFMDLDFSNDPLMMKQVLHGDIVGTTPNIPLHDGFVFQNWVQVDPTTFQALAYVYDSTVVVADMLVDELYDRAIYMVYVLNWDGQLLASGQVYHGNSINNLNDFIMPREGYQFIGWTDDLQYVTKTTFTIAMYRPIATGNTTVIYSDKDNYYMTQEDVTLNLPQAPAIEGYEFIRWDVIGGDLRNGIQIQAIYESTTPTGAPEVEGQKDAARKELREGIVYVLKDNAIYTVTGQKVQ